MSAAARALALHRIRVMAQSLGPVNSQLVFIGAAILPLLVTDDDRWSVPRSTDDVDAVAATATYTQQALLEEALRSRGFKPSMDGRHIGRYRAPDGSAFDLSFAGDHPGGTGSMVDALAIETAETVEGTPPIRHLSATGFFLMKQAAFRDRGRAKLFESKDLADLAVLLVGRTSLLVEMQTQAAESSIIKDALISAANALLAEKGIEAALRTHFRSRAPIAPDTDATLAEEGIEQLKAIASLRA
ncbi:MAG: hypothetical protein ACREN6_03315 [Gemmatimonadaceae bacterium]